MARIQVQANKIFETANKSRARYILLKGSAGSGKSVDTAQNYIIRLMKDSGRNLLALRKSEVTNRDSTYAELCGAITRMGLWDYWRPIMSPLELRCVNGAKIIFRGMNDDRQREKIKSITFERGSLTDIWLEEATEFTRADVDILDDRLRGKLPDGLFYQMRFTFNPVAATHWIKRDYFDIPSPDVFTHHSTYLDNRFIDAAFHKRMMRRKELDPEGYNVYGLGEWGEVGGLILTNWTVEEVSQDLNDYDAVYMGQDFGFNHYNAILLVGFRDDEIYVLREQYESEKDTGEIISSCTMPKEPVMYCDSAEPDRIKTWNSAGWNAKAVVKEPGSVGAQIDYLKTHKIHIHPSCVNLMKELQQWKWRRDEKKGVWLDEPTPFFDDAIAALRYAIEGIRKPHGIKIYDVMM